MFETLVAASPEFAQPYVKSTLDAFYLLFSVGIISVLFLEIFKRVERLFIKEDNPNWRIVHKERPFFKREFRSELCWPILNAIFLVPLLALEHYLLVELFLQRHLPQQPLAGLIEQLPFFVQVVLGLFVLDLILYIRHRFVHHFFWPYHTIHHSAREITWLTTLRLHPIDTFVMGIILTTLLYIIGFGGEGIALANIIQFHFNRFAHSNLALDFPGPLRYILVSPNMHRWHHAADDPRAFNKNYAIVFAFIDVLFGTFYVPKNRLPNVYGVLDEHGEQVVSERYVDQLVYPLRHHRSWIGRKWSTIQTRLSTRQALKKSKTP